MWSKAIGIHVVEWTPLLVKMTYFQNAILGGYKDWSETWILCGFSVIVWLFICYAMWIEQAGSGASFSY